LKGDKEVGRTANLILLLGGIFALAVFIRAYFPYDLALRDFLVSGGSDAFYYKWLIDHIVTTGKHLVRDPMLNYPLGMNNPRPPIYAWSVALIGIFVGSLQGSVQLGIWQSFLFSTALWGALTIFPTYFLARDIFGRRAGLLAAFFLAVMPAHIQRTPLSNGDHDALVLFFVVTAFYFFLRALGELKERTWVESWFRPTSIYTGLRRLVLENKRPILLSVMAGTSIAVVALTWQGWAYAPVVVIAYFLVQLLVHKLRNQDPMGVLLCFTVTLGTAHLLAAPYYVATGFVRTWFDVPLFLFAASVALGLLFAVFHRLPWMLVIPPIILGFTGGLAIASLYSPTVAQTLTSGLGYFVRTKVYETIAEAQPPNLSQAILSFGAVTYYLSMFGIVWMAIQFLRKPRPDYLFALAWSAAAIFMAMSAVRFIFNASPAFAITSAWITVLIVERLGLEQVRKAVASTGGSKWVALKRGLRVRHVAGALFVAFLLILPNTWYAVDAAIPFERKQALDLEVYERTPEPLRPEGYREGSLFYFGAFGYSLPLKTRYFPKAWEWLRQQDADVVPYWKRPAFLSWWDYGFEAIQEGRHPAVADNFQNGFEYAGHFLAAQSENEAIAVLNVRLLYGDLVRNRGSMSEDVQLALEERGLDSELVRDALRRPTVYIPLIRSDPERFGEWDARLSARNARVIFVKTLLTERLDLEGQADLYRELRQLTGDSILYFAVDSRLVPFSGTNTGIFYAPIKLSDFRTVEMPDGRSIPIDFYRLVAETDRGEYDLEDVPTTARVFNVRIEYKEKFYNSMLYRIFFGIRGQDLGKEDDGLPAISGQLQAEDPLHGWMLRHFKMVYRTAYFNPRPPEEAANATEDWTAVNIFDALKLREKIDAGEMEGTVDLSARSGLQQGIVILKYYDGAVLRGRVATEDGRPLGGVRITVLDELDIPHDVTLTDASGSYEVLLPFGDVRLVASVGELDNRTRIGRNILEERRLRVTESQALRLPLDTDEDGRPDYILEEDFKVSGAIIKGIAFLDLNGNSRRDDEEGVLPGLEVEVRDADGEVVAVASTNQGGGYVVADLLPGTYSLSLKRAGLEVASVEVPLALGQTETKDIAVRVSRLSGRVQDEFGQPAAGAVVELVEDLTGQRLQALADTEGNYTFQALFEGNYTLEVILGDRGTLPQRVMITRGENSTRDLRVEPMGELKVRSLLSFTPTPFVTFTLLRRGEGSAATITTDSTTYLQTRLPEGTYDVYSLHYRDGRPYSLLTVIHISQTSQFLELNLAPAHRVYGRVLDPDGGGGSRATVTFQLDAARLTLTTDDDGSFLTYLPPGTYSLWALSESGQRVSTLDLRADTRLDVTLEEGIPVEGRVFRDLNLNGSWDPGEGLAGVRIELTDESGRAFSVLTEEEGRYRITLLRGTTYTVTFLAEGFQPVELGPLTAIEFGNVSVVRLEPEAMRVIGQLEGPEGVDLEGVEIRLEGLEDGAATAVTTADAEGGFEVFLLPGLYRLVVDVPLDGVDEDVRLQNLQEETVRVPVGKEAGPLVIRVVERVKLSGEIDAAGKAFEGELVLRGPEDMTLEVQGNLSVFLQPGNYTLYATSEVGGNTYALLELVEISNPTNLTLSLVEAAVLSGTVNVAGDLVARVLPFSVLREDGARVDALTDRSGIYRVPLVSGSYMVTLDWRGMDSLDGALRFVRYTISEEVSLVEGQTTRLDLDLVRSLDNSTLTGRVVLSDQLVSALITLEPANETAVFTSFQATAGVPFEASVAPGVYNLYAYRETGKSVSLTRVLVSPMATTDIEIPLEAGYRVAGVASLEDGSKEVTTIEFASSASVNFTTDQFGFFEVYLPAGEYQVQARAQRIERGMDVHYKFSGSLSLESSTLLNLHLSRVNVQGVEVLWDPSQQLSVLPEEEAVYTITVRNTGNVEDTFRLAGSPSDWGFEFEPREVTLPFGTDNEAIVRVTITPPADAEVAHEPIFVRATSVTNSSARYLAEIGLDIIQVRDLTLRLSEDPPAMMPEALEYTVEVYNDGNGEDVYTVVLTNPQTLVVQGWRAKLIYKDETFVERVEDVAVPAREARTLTLRLEAIGPVSASKVVLLAFSQEDRTVESYLEIPVSFPSLSIPGEDVSLEGRNVRLGPPEFPIAIYGLIAAAAAITAVLLIVRHRRRRWRR
jgi:dolichyl-diphosphooligosaccharide--protein glycosyltransferase